MKRIIVLFAIMNLTFNIFAQDSTESEGKFSGLTYSDIYYIIKDHKQDIKDLRGIWFRRIYFTYDYTFDRHFSTRFRLEMTNEGDFTSKTAMVPFVKDVWLKYKFDKHELIIGIHPPPAFEVIEKIWDYRSVEKTPLDLQRMATSRDVGVSIKGKFEDEGIFKYHLTLSGGSSNKQEVDKGKSVLLSLGFYPTKEWILELYGDYADHDGDTDWYTWQAFLSYVTKNFWSGIQYADQTRNNGRNGDYKLRVASVFSCFKVAEKLTILGRVDRMFDPNPEGEKIPFIPFDPTARSTFFLAGIDWAPINKVSVIPNIEFVTYDRNDDGVVPGNDLIGRITFYWWFD